MSRANQGAVALFGLFPLSACHADFGEAIVLYQIGLFGLIGLAGVGFATYQAYRAWGGWSATKVCLGLLVLDLVPYLGPILVLALAKKIHTEALDATMEDELS